MIELEHVSKSFGGVKAVKDVNLIIDHEKILGLIGCNGAGKTTLFNLIAGQFPATSGRILFDGEDVTALPAYDRAKLGIARTFQIPQPLMKLSLFENVLVGAFMRTADRDEAGAAAMAVLDQTGLVDKADLYAGELTTPDLKRLEVARALATGPQVLLLDEVMAGLRPAEVDAAMEMCRTIQKSGVTIVLVEHVMYAVMNLCEHVVVLDQGSIIADDTPENIAADSRVIDIYLGREHANDEAA